MQVRQSSYILMAAQGLEILGVGPQRRGASTTLPNIYTLNFIVPAHSTDFFQESAKKDICLHPDAGFAGAGREQKHLVGVGESLLGQKTPLAAGTKHHSHGKIVERHIGVQRDESRRNCIMFGKREHDNFRAGSVLKTAYQRRDSVPGLPGFFKGFQPGGSIGESRGEDKAEERNVLPHQERV